MSGEAWFAVVLVLAGLPAFVVAVAVWVHGGAERSENDGE